MTYVYILIGILVFGILIASHEFGHFITAKACGVRVEEFSVGMGPALWKKQKGETLYALRCIPIGGYCAMTGEDSASEDPRAFTNQKPWKRILILCAGAAMNFLFGLLVIFFIYISAQGFYVPVLNGFMEGCPYEAADGLQAGDQFWSIDGHRIYNTQDVGTFLSRGGDTYDIVMIRNGEKVKLDDYRMVPLVYDDPEHEYFGFYLGNGVERATFGKKLQRQDVSVGLETDGEALENILILAALIAINLAIMNMLPIPALDGGRVFLLLVTVLIEAVTRKKLNPKYEGYIHAAGMVLLLGLMAFVMFHDIWRIFTT